MDRPQVNVLIIEDNQWLLDILTEQLTKDGFKVSLSMDGQACFEILNEERIDIIMLDYKLPGEDGLTVLRRIRREYPEIPTVFMTAHGSEEVAVEALKAGVSDYLIKPLKIPRIGSSLLKTIKKHEEHILIHSLR